MEPSMPGSGIGFGSPCGRTPEHGVAMAQEEKEGGVKLEQEDPKVRPKPIINAVEESLQRAESTLSRGRVKQQPALLLKAK
jgi:hypothetical protein